MRVEFHTRNAEVSDRLRAHAEPRLADLEGLYDRTQEVRVTLSGQKGWKTVEITLDADGVLLRSEERTNDEFASFDKALDKLERQLRRYRERVRSHPKTPGRESPLVRPADTTAGEEPPEDSDLEIGEIEITRTKSHPLKPMTPEEAALQMELLGHDFFMFFNPQSDQVELVYRRHNGGYGLIEPVLG